MSWKKILIRVIPLSLVAVCNGVRWRDTLR